MKKLALALGILLTTTVTAQSATIMAAGYMNGVEIHKSPITPIPGLNCKLAVASFQIGMEGQLGAFPKPLAFKGMFKAVKIYKGRTAQGIDIVVACSEDGVRL